MKESSTVKGRVRKMSGLICSVTLMLGLMKYFKKRILDSNMEACLKLLTKNNEDEIEEDELFACIQRVGLTATKFEAVLALTTLNKKNDIVNKV
jgi:hypothetical protein